MKEIPFGFCRCGCGELTKIAEETNAHFGYKKGIPLKYIHGHNMKPGNTNPNWKTGETVINGYPAEKNFTHPNRDSNNYVRKHTLIAEKALGRILKHPECVHHFDGERPTLVVCENQAYHMLLHQRTRAYRSCGHADWRKCKHCKQYSNPSIMKKVDINSLSHVECLKKYEKERWNNQKQKGGAAS